MKSPISTWLALVFTLAMSCELALCQVSISPQAIAQAIANDSGRDASFYAHYSRKLSKTLEQYTPEQLEVVFGGNTYLGGPDNGKPLSEELGLQPVTFKKGGHLLSDEAKVEVDKVFAHLQANPDAMIMISGHSNGNGGSDPLQSAIALRRANEARDYLLKKGISKDRIQTRSLGSTQPVVVDENGVAVKDRRNRRIGIDLMD